MKQSTKLLSLVLAIVMAFSCMSVIGSAASTIPDHNAVTYDSIDDALLTPEQVADIALDLVDGLLIDADLGVIEVDLLITKMVLLDLTNIDTTLDTLFALADGTLFGLAAGIVNLGDLENLDFGPLEWQSSGNGVQRGNGNLQVVYHLIDFIGCDTNAKVLQKAAYGINVSGGIELGLLGDLLGDLDLSEINDILANLKGFLGEMIYDMLLHGSYRHELNAEELKEAGQSLPYGGSLDGMIENALLNLVVDPQAYDYDKETDEKVWDEASILIPSLKAALDKNKEDDNPEDNRQQILNDLDLNSKSVFDVINYVAQYAIDDLGIIALNNNLKKALMEAVEVEFNEIQKEELPGSLEDDITDDIIDIFEDEAAYTTFISYDRLLKDEVTGEWYYTTMKTQDKLDDKGNPVRDEDKNIVTERVRVYYKANTATANKFYDLINWDYEIYSPSDDTGADDAVITEAEYDGDESLVVNTIDYDALIARYGSLVESLNHIIWIVFQNALMDDVKDDFAAITGEYWLDGATSATMENSDEKVLNNNISRLVKYLLVKFPDMIFGKDSVYALEKAEYDDEAAYYNAKYAAKTIIDMVALIGPSFFEDVMPQLIIPVDENGAFTFATSDADGVSVAILQFGALVLREFMTEIAPSVNYDNVIFAANTLTSAEGRQFANHSAEEWFNIILNMGVDVGFTYLGNITNFGDKLIISADGTSVATKNYRTTTLPTTPTAAEAVSEERWQGKLDEAIMWAVRYVGLGSNGILTGINPDTVATKDGPFNKLSYILNTILPLGFVNGCESANYDLDVEVLFNKFKTLVTTFDLTELASVFGRNGIDGSTLKRGNILAQPVIPMALGLVNDILSLVFNKEILPVEDSLDNLVTQANASTLIYRILTGLNSVKEPLLISALPVVGKLIKGWGTEQNFGKPDIDVPSVIELNSGAATETVSVKNGADGIWRSWVDANGRQYDQQYKIQLTDVKFIDFETGAEIDTSNVDDKNLNTSEKIDFGKSGTFDISVSGLNSSKIVRMDVYYKVYEGDNEMVSGATYKESVNVYISAVASDEGKETIGSDTKYSKFVVWSTQYFDINKDGETLKKEIEERRMMAFWRDKDDYNSVSGKADKGKMTVKVISGSDPDGAIVPGSVSTGDEFGAGTTRNFDPLKIFVNGNYTSSNGDKTITVAGASVDAAKLAEKEHGDVTSFTFRRHEETSSTDICGNTTTNNYDADLTLTLAFYDAAARSALEGAVNSEIRRGRVEADYLTDDYSYADRVLAYETTVDEVTKEETIKETNFTDTAWVDNEGEPLADDIKVTPDDENEEIGTYEIDGVKYSAKLVTKINNATVWASYEAAVKAAAAAALDGMTVNAVKNADYKALQENLNAAATDISYCRADVEADPTVGNAITELKATLDSVEEATTDKYDYTDYMMWRLNRLNDAREDAQYYIDLKKDADREYKVVDKKFPYSWIEKDDLTALLALEDNAATINGNGELITALLEDLTTAEEKDKKAWLEDRDAEYAEVTAFDIAYAKSMLEKTSTRLRDREYKVNGKADTTYLATEIASADAMITDSTLYTERSWTKYAKALAAAKAVVNGDSQKDAFDKKWELLCCRNELVLVEDEADYSELIALMEQAQFALNNQDKYDNTKEELGQVLAELGFCSYDATASEAGKFTLLGLKNADGYDVNLFPGSAAYTNAEPYAKDEQDVIDSAADQLKEALARLKFINLGVTAVEGNGEVDYAGETEIIFDDEETKDVDESVIVKLAIIGAGMNEDAVKALFNVTADKATVGADNITVSNDRYYSIEQYEKDEEGNYVLDEETGEKILAPFQGFAGTNSVVTFYTLQDGIKIPVATIKLVVKGDINGDGSVNVIDAAQMHLAANDMATLEGCFAVAGEFVDTEFTKDSVINGDDYTQLINVVVA